MAKQPYPFLLPGLVDIFSSYLNVRDLLRIVESELEDRSSLLKVRNDVWICDTSFGLELLATGFQRLTFRLRSLYPLESIPEYVSELDLSAGHGGTYSSCELENLVNLTSLNLAFNERIDDDGLSNLVNLT